jgi:hypothetical protein
MKGTLWTLKIVQIVGKSIWKKNLFIYFMSIDIHQPQNVLISKVVIIMVQFVLFQYFVGGDHDNHFPWHDQLFKWPLHT